jgi:trk/ktr system potassium uptake protein
MIDGVRRGEEHAERAERRLTFGMAAAAFCAFAALVVDYGGGSGALRPFWRQLQMTCGLIFIMLQCAKPAVVPHPLQYLRRHRIDYILILVLLSGLLGSMALRQSPEFRYLVGHGAQEPLEALPVLAIQGYLVFLVLLKSPWFHRALLALPLGASTALWTSFAGLIAIGTLLLRLPGAAATGRSTGWIDALFTATSAACVTGLAVVDTGSHFSGFGQGVILALIQIGGLGVLTLTGSVALLGGGALSGREREGLADLAECDALPLVRAALTRPLLLTAAIEAAGSAALYLAWRDPLRDVGPQAWEAIFHAVSAFCNAGFGLWSDGLGRFAAAPLTLALVGGLIVLGGLGFGVLWDVAGALGRRLLRRPTAPLQAQSRAALLTAAVLIPAGGLGIWLLERGGVLAQLPPGRALANALFLSVSSRTAGFGSFDLASLGLASSGLLIVLMIVGGAAGSTAGGIKTTTLWALLHPQVSPALRRRAAVLAIALPASLLLTGLLLRLLAAGLPGLWFEAASALGTVGLSRGATPSLPPAARLLLVAAMLFGRLGPFLIAFAMRRRARRAGVPVEGEPYQIG